MCSASGIVLIGPLWEGHRLGPWPAPKNLNSFAMAEYLNRPNSVGADDSLLNHCWYSRRGAEVKLFEKIMAAFKSLNYFSSSMSWGEAAESHNNRAVLCISLGPKIVKGVIGMTSRRSTPCYGMLMHGQHDQHLSGTAGATCGAAYFRAF